MLTSNDGLGVLISSAVAGGGFAAYQTVLKWRRYRRQEREFVETKRALIASQTELETARAQLVTKGQDLDSLTMELQAARGENGTQLSERVIMGRDLQRIQRQLEETRQQLDRTKSELRSKQMNEPWGDDSY